MIQICWDYGIRRIFSDYMSHVKLWNSLELSLLYVRPLRRERSHTVEVKIIANKCNDSVTSAKKNGVRHQYYSVETSSQTAVTLAEGAPDFGKLMAQNVTLES